MSLSRRSTNAMSRDSASGTSRYGSSRSRGADSSDGYSHHSSSRSHTTSSRYTSSRGYDDNSHSSLGSPLDLHSRTIERYRARVASDDSEGYPSAWTERMCWHVANADCQCAEYHYTVSRSIIGSNGGSCGGGSADYSSTSHGGSVSRSHSTRHGGGASQLSRNPSTTRGESRRSSTRRTTHGESSRAPSALAMIQEESRVSESRASGGASRALAGASRALARITGGGQSNGGHSSSHVGRELARRY